MAPLVPEYINEHFGLLIAVVIGFGFGFALEQAGFSSTRKLAGLFYGYDFTVLRVFFTAGVTAMLGTLMLSKFGWLDLELIYINPTYLQAAVIGGSVMGLGFIIGGFCPGTSVVSAAIGRIDGMVFVVGGALGVFLFGELYPWLHDYYLADYMGAPLLGEWLSVSKETMAIAITLVALFAFAFTYFVEKRVNGESSEFRNPKTLKRVGGFSALLLIPAILIISTPDFKDGILEESKLSENLGEIQSYSPDKLAYTIMNPEDLQVNLIDVRDSLAFAKGNLPTSFNIPLKGLLDSKWEAVLKGPNRLNIFYAEDEKQAQRACFIANKLGYGNAFILKGGKSHFEETIFSEKALGDNPTIQDRFDQRFREKARIALPRIATERKLKPIAKPKKKKKAQGGCT
ncbi:hypothetical protein FUAX_40330 (plasmid) [Fulvitalea axinellae]|uniref:Rhodanese domain-containing protein n=1 Tax=Fulvitalea axinellae TaxID=1182444 RepID=A0AAU9CHG2_9BACT|nr:hypothetical protein FUAX_40330 [Fulvitalea axinellae]